LWFGIAILFLSLLLLNFSFTPDFRSNEGLFIFGLILVGAYLNDYFYNTYAGFIILFLFSLFMLYMFSDPGVRKNIKNHIMAFSAFILSFVGILIAWGLGPFLIYISGICYMFLCYPFIGEGDLERNFAVKDIRRQKNDVPEDDPFEDRPKFTAILVIIFIAGLILTIVRGCHAL